ncbi:MAG: hypothetical protein UZ04_CHB001001661 [Chlorobi bacterium OLB4]|nr:MAG: hypothetical protein UZ04_CHB001001661 [Chlorobi bacterium OLB4]
MPLQQIQTLMMNFLIFFSRNEITVFSHINTAEELSSAIVKWSESILE